MSEETPGERSMRIMLEVREQEAADTAAAEAAGLRDFPVGWNHPESITPLEKSAYIVGYKTALRDERKKR